MSNKLKFDECLKYLLTILNIRMSQLSKSINVDSSLISHWIHGKRIPPYGSSYIEHIAEYISKCIHNSYQESLLKAFLSSQYGDTPIPESTADSIRVLLMEAQGYSIECRTLLQKSSRAAHASSSLAHEIDTTCTDNSGYLSKISATLIQGTEQIFQASTLLINEALQSKAYKGQTIYITYTNTFQQLLQPESYFYSLRERLLQLIKNGWKIIFLLRIDNNINRIIDFIHYSMPIIKTGEMKIYYLSSYDVMMDRELYAISGVGVLTCFPTDTSNLINCGFLLNEKNAVNSYIKYFQVLLSKHSRKLIKFYGKLSRPKYYEDILKTKSCIGKQINYNCAFSMTLIPESLYQKLLNKVGLSSDNISKSLSYYTQQRTSIISNLSHDLFLNIFFADTMEQVVCSRSLLLYTYAGVERVFLEVSELIDYLQGIIDFINSYENFQIALLYRNDENYGIHEDIRIIVKERNAVYIHALEPEKKTSETRLCIEESTIVKAFIEYYSIIWSHIAPINKDKNEYILLLQRYIETLKTDLL